jgi:hypothetical protein
MATQLVDLSEEARAWDLVSRCEAPEYAIVVALRNIGAAPQAFKCKTNAPRRWSVRPNGGVVEPGETVEVCIRVMQRASALAGIEDDRHLILSAPVSEHDAARLRELRDSNNLHSETPGVSQTRLTPTFASLPDRDETRHGSPSASALVASDTMLSPTTAAGFASPRAVVEAPTRHTSVADQVAELDRKYSVPALNGRPPRPSTPVSDSGSDATSDAWDGGGGALALLRRLLRRLLSSARDEFSAWLSCARALAARARLRARHAPTAARPALRRRRWKVYDILWALALLLLGRRLKWVRDAQEALDL